VIVYVYVSPARLDVQVTQAAVRQRRRQLPKATAKGAAKANPSTQGGDANLQAYRVEQVAKMLHIGRDKVYELIRTGQLRSIKIGKLRRITEEQLAEFIASLEDAA
jgi:excisionase family DNA binding protein